MLKNKLINTAFIVIILSLLSLSVAYGYNDGFGSAHKISGKHFIVFYTPGLEIPDLVRQLDIGPSERVLVGKSTQKKLTFETELIDMLDTLFMQVSDILDIHLYSLQGKIKVCRDYSQLSQVYDTLFNADLANQRSFYIHELKTVYVSVEGFTPEILGHEIAHMIICHYFVVPPPYRVQEVLAGYVEYQLRKRQR